MGAEPLWAITSYFNPAGFQRRRQNYQVFRRALTVPLVTVELSFDGTFQLRPGDADILVQLRGTDIMWQKERLLNIALRHVPTTCQKIAWLDCDVIFGSDNWAVRASRALDEVAIVHLFHEKHDLPPDADLAQLPAWTAEPTAFSSVYKVATGQAAPDEFRLTDVHRALRSSLGLAWAGRRNVLMQHGLYDACIMGGGDRAIANCALGRAGDLIAARRINPRCVEHYLAWARPFFDTVQGRVGYVPGRIFHLWHGAMDRRQYRVRHTWLKDFDPLRDIALDASGCWRWCSDKPDLHATVQRYFASRNEDDAGTHDWRPV